MGWPTFTGTWPTVTTAFAGENAMKARHPVRGRDASGGRTIAYTAWDAATYYADVKPKQASEVDDAGRENIVARYEVTTGARFSPRDQFLWVDTGLILTVIAVIASGSAAARTWTHVCEEHG